MLNSLDRKDMLEKYCVLRPFVETKSEMWREADGSEALGLCVESPWLHVYNNVSFLLQETSQTC